jgi:hypothetical protein
MEKEQEIWYVECKETIGAAASKETGLEVNADKTKYCGHVLRSECRKKSQYEE